MKFDAAYLREQCAAILAGEDVDWDQDTMAAHIVSLLDLVRSVRDRPHTNADPCPWCHAEQSNVAEAINHKPECPAFGEHGAGL